MKSTYTRGITGKRESRSGVNEFDEESSCWILKSWERL
jgi:hypothetical protein